MQAPQRESFNPYGSVAIDAHGDPWQIPVIRSQNGLSASNHLVEGTPEELKYLWHLAGELFDHHVGEVRLSREDLAAAAIKVVALNYDISEEMSESGAFDDGFIAGVVKAAIDWPTAASYLELRDRDRETGHYLNSRLLLVHNWMRGRMPCYRFSRADQAVACWMTQAERPVENHSHFHLGR